MRIVLKLALRVADRARARAGSELRKFVLRATYPGLTIDRATFVGRGCAITCSDGSAMELIGTYVGRSAVLKADAGGRLQIGRSYVGPGSMVIAAERVDIGDLCQLAEYVVVRDHDHLVEGHIPLDRNEFVTTPVAIGERVWIGAKATILRGGAHRGGRRHRCPRPRHASGARG